MNKQTYFYQILEPISKELAHVARELEKSIIGLKRALECKLDEKIALAFSQCDFPIN
ncbi:hypothetical protein ACFFHM_01815 [Halalkalibacter kiskunsagensis]|uniref:Uncharacterized protein n=1 Tax=Halalkalibacter kiskunsagensis TaxID=1548599 RepID=A0ABV6K7L8_9BACI